MKKKGLLFGVSLTVILSLSGCQKAKTSVSASAAASTSPSVARSASPSASPVASVSASPSVISASESTSVSTKKALFTEKAFDSYIGDPKYKYTDVSYAFKDGQEDLPFISLENAKTLLGHALVDGLDDTTTVLTLTANGSCYTLTGENGAAIVFDFANQTLTYPDFNHFFSAGPQMNYLDTLSWKYEENGVTSYVKRDPDHVFCREEYSKTVDFKSYDIPLILDEGTPYLPLQTLSDFVFNPFGLQLLYNTKAVFLVGSNDLSTLSDLFYSASPTNRSEALARFNCDELAANLDTFYGLKEEHDIPSFKTMITQSGLEKDMLSTDPLISSTAISYLLRQYFSDFHSGNVKPSFYVGKDVKISPDIINPYRSTALEEMNAYRTERAKVYPDGVPSYEEFGTNKDTAFVTFDHFASATQDYYTKAATLDSTDTFGVIEYAHSQIFRTGSNVKNVVIDLSCNGGGAVDAAIYLNGWVLANNYLPMENTLTGFKAMNTYQSDVNMDHVFDENDRISDKNIFILTSPASFSCGNLVPAVLRSTNKVTLLGRASGGGTCVVYPSCSADGTTFQFSGPMKLCTVKNGTFYSVDQGVSPDYVIEKKSDFYQREALAEYIDTLL
jgi:hypothetical protein